MKRRVENRAKRARINDFRLTKGYVLLMFTLFMPIEKGVSHGEEKEDLFFEMEKEEGKSWKKALFGKKQIPVPGLIVQDPAFLHFIPWGVLYAGR